MCSSINVSVISSWQTVPLRTQSRFCRNNPNLDKRRAQFAETYAQRRLAECFLELQELRRKIADYQQELYQAQGWR